MSQQDGQTDPQPSQNNSSEPPPHNSPITSEVAQSLLTNQAVELSNEAARIELQKKQLDYNADYAKEALRLEAADVANRPKETRKTIWQLALIVGFFVLALLGFVIYLLEKGHKDLVLSILKGVGWMGSTIAAYFLGANKSDRSKSVSSDTSNAEVMN